MSEQIKVLVVDDSALVRKIITDILESDPQIKVVGTANNGKTAIFRNEELDPDVITMDIEMPILDGLSALKAIIEQKPKPVIMMSVLTQHGAEATFRALEYGAIDFIPKPSSMLSLSVEEIGVLLISKIKSVAHVRVARRTAVREEAPPRPVQAPAANARNFEKGSSSSRVVGIGTSTGGPSALFEVFRGFPDNFPSPVVVVQHMPEGFTRAFSERLNSHSSLNIKEAEDGDIPVSGCGYIAPGHSHLIVEKKGAGLVLRVIKGEKVSGHRPSIDVLFNSLAESVGGNSLAVIMTGMGRDGADGIERIHKLGGYTLAQNEETSVVYGMNRVAVEKGAIDEVVALSEITKKIVEHI
jgi:two-component system chemotaxis response regulator CheB